MRAQYLSLGAILFALGCSSGNKDKAQPAENSSQTPAISSGLTAQAANPVVEAIEFYHKNFDHYFITSNPPEITALDTGYFTGWKRTGYKFNVITAGSNVAGTNPVCRFYGRPEAGLDSHFYSASPAECEEVKVRFADSWQFESDEVFRSYLPNTTTGACPAGTTPVYRLFNGRSDANHRYTTDLAVFTQMRAKGYIAEGYGNPNQPVALCAPAANPGEFKLTCEEAKFLALINIYRGQYGLAALKASQAGTQAGRWHAQDMGQNHYFDHTDSLGRDFHTRCAAFGYYATGENAAGGTYTARDAFCIWKTSPGHNENMLRSQFRSIGVGRASVSGSAYGVYWSTPFGGTTNDAVLEPVTNDAGCNIPTSLPSEC